MAPMTGRLFLERRRSEALVFDDGRVKTASYDAAEGFGLSARCGARPRAMPIPPRSAKRRYARGPDNGATGRRRGRRHACRGAGSRRISVSMAMPTRSPTPRFPVKIETLREIDAFARGLDPRVVQVSATLAASLQEVAILRPDGRSSLTAAR